MHQESYLTSAIIANMRYGVAATLLLAVTAGATYHAAVALRWISLGDVPGEEAPYFGLFYTAALIALLVGAIVSLTLAWRHESNLFVALLGIAAAALVVTSFYSFDPYYLPTMRRYSDGGTFSPTWVYAVAGFGLLSTWLCLTSPRTGFVVNAPALFLCAFTVTFLGVGH
jgi:hypothetical protein